jgi:hypothetical protein
MRNSRRRLSCVVLLLASACAAQETNPAAEQPEGKPEIKKIEGALVQLKNLPAERLIGPYIPTSGPFVPLTLKQRANVYIRQTYDTPGPYVVRLFSAGVDQARNAPPEWGGGMGAYGERLASRYGRFIIANTVSAAGNALGGYEPRYDLCRCHTFLARSRHAIVRNFVFFVWGRIRVRDGFVAVAARKTGSLERRRTCPGFPGRLWERL